MSKALDLTLSLGKRLVGSYSRPNEFIAWYCTPRKLSGSWLTAPWCAMFASHVLKSAGVKTDAFAYCPTWVNKFKSDKKWGVTPRVGAVAFFDWDGDKLADHVGIVVKVGGSQVDVLEGNTTVGVARNRVAVQHRGKGLVMGYGYPDYGTTASVKKYVIKKGDTLSKIAKTYGVTWQALYAANAAAIGSNPNLLKVGTQIAVS